MRHRLTHLTVLLVCLLTLSACADPFVGFVGHSSTSVVPPAPTTTLTGILWTLAQLSAADGQLQPLVPTAPVNLEFQNNSNTYFGSSGCNYYNGTYALSGYQLHLEFDAVTLKACATAIMSQEVTYLNTLQQVTSYEVNGQSLALSDKGGTPILVFVEAHG